MNINDDQIWYNLEQLIILLVKRKKPDQNDLSLVYYKGDHSWCTCDICGQEMSHDDHCKVREHYVEHLKESNLLPFI